MNSMPVTLSSRTHGLVDDNNRLKATSEEELSSSVIVRGPPSTGRRTSSGASSGRFFASCGSDLTGIPADGFSTFGWFSCSGTALQDVLGSSETLATIPEEPGNDDLTAVIAGATVTLFALTDNDATEASSPLHQSGDRTPQFTAANDSSHFRCPSSLIWPSTESGATEVCTVRSLQWRSAAAFKPFVKSRIISFCNRSLNESFSAISSSTLRPLSCRIWTL